MLVGQCCHRETKSCELIEESTVGKNDRANPDVGKIDAAANVEAYAAANAADDARSLPVLSYLTAIGSSAFLLGRTDSYCVCKELSVVFIRVFTTL